MKRERNREKRKDLTAPQYHNGSRIPRSLIQQDHVVILYLSPSETGHSPFCYTWETKHLPKSLLALCNPSFLTLPITGHLPSSIFSIFGFIYYFFTSQPPNHHLPSLPSSPSPHLPSASSSTLVSLKKKKKHDRPL